MRSRSSVARGPGFEPRRRHGKPVTFLGFDAEEMAPKVRVAGALSVLVPVALSGFALIAFVPGLWWIFTTYFWVAFPAFGLLARGLMGLSGIEPARATEAGERELLEALREHGELTPILVAVETSLTVAEADQMLKGLAEAGYLEVKVYGGGLSYALWRAERPSGSAAPTRQIAERMGHGWR